ncbi:MAG: phosphate acyltransferase PlsX [Pseudomonadota bacterium]
MNDGVVVSIDAMGGDHGPAVTLSGAARVKERLPTSSFLLFGDQALIDPELAKFPELAASATVHHTDVAIPMDAKPSQALRRTKRTSSMWMALEAVRDGKAQVCVSAGNTGALMAMSKICLKMQRGIERPAIAAIWPTVRAECVVLDVGANVGASAEQLVDFAVMGATMARTLFNTRSPRLALLNIGEEEVKGLDDVKRAHTWLREHGRKMNYVGFIEGDDIGHDTADVVVTEGFSGNIALKTAEGTAIQVGQYVKAAMKSSWLSKLGALIAAPAFRALKHQMDPRRLNGGTFLGLNGLVIKSHGGTDAVGFASAIEIGVNMARGDIVARIGRELETLDHEAGRGRVTPRQEAALNAPSDGAHPGAQVDAPAAGPAADASGTTTAPTAPARHVEGLAGCAQSSGKTASKTPSAQGGARVSETAG